MCSIRASAGGPAEYLRPQACSPALVSQTHGGPRLRTAESARPALAQRAASALACRKVPPCNSASWSSWSPYISAVNKSSALLLLARPAAVITLSSEHGAQEKARAVLVHATAVGHNESRKIARAQRGTCPGCRTARARFPGRTRS